MFRRPKDERGGAAWDKGRAATERLLMELFGPQHDRINWRGPNWWTIVAICIALALTKVPSHPIFFGRDVGLNIASLIGWVGAVMVRRVVSSYGDAVDDFKPSKPLHAKQANEQIKLVANLVNGAAGAAVTVFALSEMVRSDHPDYVQIILAVAMALWVHSAARGLVGKLKDEASV